MKLEISAAQSTSQDTGHDRLSVFRDAHRTLIALSDGADSGAAAKAAAALTVRELARCFRNGVLPRDPRDWEMILEGIDLTVFKDPVAGETSALVVLVEQDTVVGASVGDSLAYIVDDEGDAKVLTSRYSRRARMGTAIATPEGFGPVPLDGRLITRPAPKTASTGVSSTFAAA